jgi:prepilin-type N-terminal cleavage/methylation domain-containing protein
MNRINIHRGFSLIEVMLAFIIVAVSAAGLVKLQNSYMKQESSSSARESAMHLAENKLDDLRSFTTLATTTGQFAYQDIQTNVGQSLTNGLAAGNHTIGNTTYALGWTVANSPNPLPTNLKYPLRKDITITVAWTDQNGSAKTLSLSSSIAASTSIGNTEGDTLGGMDDSPQVAYTPGSAPDVVAITIKAGTKEETSKPLPTVYQSGDNVVVKTETITYDPESGRKIQEDQATLSCNCSLQSGNASKKLPAYPLLDSQGQYWELGQSVSKGYGANTSNQNAQSPLCNICCENHFDGTNSQNGSFDQYYNILRKAHGHYRLSGSNLVTAGSGSYLEACRLLRVDGFYEPMPDWNLAVINVMSPDFLSDSSNQENYEKYVQSVVRAHFAWQKAGRSGSFNPTPLNNWLSSGGNVTNGGATSTDLTLQAGSTAQLIARGVYVDLLNDETGQYLSQLDSTDEELLAKVPFNELNLTLLANWSLTTANQSYATVTNEPVQTIVDASQNYYGTYSRGRLSALQATPSTGNVIQSIPVTANIRTSNSGITSTVAISPEDLANQSANINVRITASTGNNAKLRVTGDIKCLTDPKKTGQAPEVCKANDWNTLAVNQSGVSCTVNKPSGSMIAGYFDCAVNRKAAVTLNFGASGFVMTPSSITLTATQTDPKDSNGNDIATISLNGGNACSVMMVKSTVPSPSSFSCATP